MTEENARWYIAHALSGHEKKAAAAIVEQAKKKGLAHLFEEFLVPTESVIEIKKGKKVNSEKKFLPGYLMIKMVMNDATWHIVKNIPKISGFLGSSGKPQPVSEEEIRRIYKQIEESATTSKNVVTFEVGESVKVADGPFESFVGVVEEVDLDKCRLKVSVTIFGRATPVELEYTQVSKL